MAKNTGADLLNKPAYTVDEFCAAYGIGRNSTYVEMGAGRLLFRKCGRKTLIRKIDADAWLNALPRGSLTSDDFLSEDDMARTFIEGHPSSPPN